MNQSELKTCLMTLFTPEEFAVWMKQRVLPLDLLASMPSPITAPLFYFDSVIDLLQRHGDLMSPEFCSDLLVARPRWAALIAGLAERHGHSGPAALARTVAGHGDGAAPCSESTESSVQTPSQRMSRLGQLLWYRNSLPLHDPRRAQIDDEIAGLCRDMVHPASPTSAPRAGPPALREGPQTRKPSSAALTCDAQVVAPTGIHVATDRQGEIDALEIIGPPTCPAPARAEDPEPKPEPAPAPEPVPVPVPVVLAPAPEPVPEPAAKPSPLRLAASLLVLPAAPARSGVLHGLLDFTKIMLATTAIGGVLLLAAHDLAQRLAGPEPAVQHDRGEAPTRPPGPGVGIRDVGVPSPQSPATTQLLADTAQPAPQAPVNRRPLAPPRRSGRAAAQQPALAATPVARGVPALPDRLDPRQISAQLSDLIPAREHPDLSLRIAVRPDGTVDPARTQTSDAFSTLAATLIAHPFPPSARGSGDVVCHVVQGEHTLRCDDH
ncbi:MAG: hypothetical protein JNK56_16640 [Myxococcales bacterium]|nr:hypothetical protein [Myxococcales bacterium]